MIKRCWLCLILCCIVSSSIAQQYGDSVLSPHQSILNPKKPSNLPQGYFYYANQKDSYLNSNDTLAAVDAMRMMAIAAFKLGNLTDSEIQSVEALQLLTSFKSQPKEVSSRLLGLYNQLGRIYEDIGLYYKAIIYYNNALTHATTAIDSITIINNRANVYGEQDRFEVAKADYHWVMERAKAMSDTLSLARTLNNYGNVLRRQNLGDALPVLMEGLRLRQLKNSKEGVFGSYRHLVYYFQAQLNPEQATLYARKCLEIAKELNSAAYLKEAYDLLVELNNDEAVQGYKKLTDSINEANRESQNLYAAMRFDVDQEKLNSQRAETQLEKERSQKQLTLFIAAIIALLFVLIIAFILFQIKQIKQREVFTTESRISKKVHDEVANEVYQLMVKMQLDTDTSEDWLDDLESIYNRSRDISKEINALDTNIPYHEVLIDLLSSYQCEDLRILNRNLSKYNWDVLSQDKKNALYRVIQELMTNMRKHSKATLVAFSVSENGKKTEIKYSDNGVGTLLKKQNGLQNAENRIFASNGSITFDSEPGKGFQVKIIL